MEHQREFEFWGNPERGRLLREIGIDAAEYGSEEWVELAEAVISAICQRSRLFTADRVWFYLQDAGRGWVREPRAMGAAMRRASSVGWCEPTDRTVQSVRPECHRRPVRIWRSRIFKGGKDGR